jgi:hypothetical protein
MLDPRGIAAVDHKPAIGRPWPPLNLVSECTVASAPYAMSLKCMDGVTVARRRSRVLPWCSRGTITDDVARWLPGYGMDDMPVL